MAKKSTAKVQSILDLYEQGKTAKEIKEETGASLQYIYTVKRDVFDKRDKNDEGDDGNDDFTDDETNELNDFVKKIKIEPDPNVLTGVNDDKGNNKTETEEYQCGNCGFEFEGDASSFQKRCPECGTEFA